MLIALSGPSGIGKGHIKKILLERCTNLTELAWITTRPLRPGEVAGGNRISVSRNIFNQETSAGRCVFVQELFGNGYALPKTQLSEVATGLTEIHPNNVRDALKMELQMCLIGLLTDDQELLRERLSKRGEAATVCEARIEYAVNEMNLIRELQHIYNHVFLVTRTNESKLPEHVVNVVQDFLNQY